MSENNHSISRFASYGHLKFNGPEFAKKILQDLYDDTEPILTKALSTAIAVNDAKKKRKFDEFKEEIQDQKIAKELRPPREILHKIFVNHLTRAQENKERIQQRIKDRSRPPKHDDPAMQVESSLMLRECRDLLRGANPEDRKQMIEKSLDRGDPSFLQAASSAPDQILHDETLNELQRKHAFQQDPDLEMYENQVNELENIVRAKCSQIDMTQAAIYNRENLQDPLTKTDHLQTFSPRDDHEAEMADILISTERSQQNIEAMNLEFENQNQGTGL